RDRNVNGVQTCALPISGRPAVEGGEESAADGVIMHLHLGTRWVNGLCRKILAWRESCGVIRHCRISTQMMYLRHEAALLNSNRRSEELRVGKWYNQRAR